MKKRYAIIPLLFGLLFCAGTAQAQFDGVGKILQSNKEDANTLLKAYFEPLGNGFGTDLNTGWFNTAKTHKTLGFDVTINASVAMVPGSAQSFNVQDLPLSQLEYVEDQSSSPIAPTSFGDNQSGPTMGAYADFDPGSPGEELLFSFEMPQGAGQPYVPAPMIQASVGIIKNTDISLRLIPAMRVPQSDFTFGLWGFGAKHGLNQWLPGGRFLPVDISLQAGFTKLNSSLAFDVEPEGGSDVENNYPAETWEGQKAEFNADAFTVNALVGKTLPFISFYGGVGYETSNVSLTSPGSYPVTVPNEDYNPNNADSKPKKIDKVDNPISISYDDYSSLRAVIGARLKLAIFHITGSYTLSKYPAAQVGFGFGIR